MSEIYLISDLHFGHYKAPYYFNYQFGKTLEEQEKVLIEKWNLIVNKNDVVYVLGDVAFNTRGLSLVDKLSGTKHFVRGNHDKLSTMAYLSVFNSVHGILKLKDFWLTHAPIHPNELRGLRNIHGHVHDNSINDPNYINVCANVIGGFPVNIKEFIK